MSKQKIDPRSTSQTIPKKTAEAVWSRSTLLPKGLLAGLVSGTALGLYCKLVEALTNNQIYTLLLNVDFIKFLPQPLPEWFEFLLHLLVSLGLGVVYVLWIQIRRPLHPWLGAVVLGLAASLLYFPLSLASHRVPEPNDLSALSWWFAGHLLYGLVLGFFGLRRNKSV